MVVEIVILTEDALLVVFDFYLCSGGYNDQHALVHGVCRRWRSIVLGSAGHPFL
jgi:hypothetical protein